MFPLNLHAQKQCASYLVKARYYKGQKIEVVFSDFVLTDKQSKREMFLKIERPVSGKVKGWKFLVHGLLDSHMGWESAANRLLAQGYGVIRPDLQGHARTLAKNFMNGVSSLDSAENYKINVTDVISILKLIASEYNIIKPDLVGHSYGGGIVTAVAVDPEGKKYIGRNVTVIAPYVYRIDGYQLESSLYYFGGLPFIKFIRSLMKPELRARIEAYTSDRYTNSFMKSLFEKHFIRMLDARVPKYRMSSINQIKDIERKNQRLKEREEIIERHVGAAIEITKGIRDFDGREVVESFPKDVRLKLVLGGKDKLIPKDMELEFFNLLLARGLDAELLELEGVGHMAPTEAPDIISKIISSK